MAFAISTAGIPRIKSYTDALRYHDRAAEKPWRNGGRDYPFPQKRVRHMGMRKTASGNICFRLHNTDVVTWHPDDSITIEVYTSQSTQAFANCLLPFGISPRGGMRQLLVGGWRDGKIYPIANTVRIAPDHETVETPLVWEKRRVNRKVAKAALDRTNYEEYREWWTLMRAMTPDLRLNHGGPIFRTSDVGEALANPERWHDIMTSYAASTPDHVRMAIYDQAREPVYYTERYDCVVGHNATKNCYAVPR